MTLHSRRDTPITELIGTLDLPDPTLPVPFEKFAPLKESDDMLTRAAFWAFYAAWQSDKLGKTVAASLAVEARHDAHTLHAVTKQLALRDAVIIQRADLDTLKGEAADNAYRASGVFIWLLFALSFVVGVLLTLWALGWFSRGV